MYCETENRVARFLKPYTVSVTWSRQEGRGRKETCMHCRLTQSHFQLPCRRHLLVLGRARARGLLTREDNGFMDCRAICARAYIVLGVRNFLCLMCDKEGRRGSTSSKLDLWSIWVVVLHSFLFTPHLHVHS